MPRSISFLIALLVIAANLRPSITSVGSLLKTIQDELALSATAAGVLTSLPLLMFAAFAPVARLARRHGTERMLLVALVGLFCGILVRSEGHVVLLFAGTVLLASSIAVANILLPILVKQHYPERVATITTWYATVMGGCAALASGVAVPLAHVLPGGWQSSLASWSLLAAVAGVLWLPHLRQPGHAAKAATQSAPGGLPWRSPLAWQVTGYMGLQATVFYVTVSWYPAMLRDSGTSAATSGWLLTLYQAAALVGGLLVPVLIRRFRDQRLLGFGAGLFAALGSLGVLIAPAAAPLWMLVLGCGSGPGLILALTYMGLRSKDPQSAATLSLMAQSIGYLLAACGPVAFGFLHDTSGGWVAPMTLVIGVALGQGLCGLGAGRLLKV